MQAAQARRSAAVRAVRGKPWLRAASGSGRLGGLSFSGIGHAIPAQKPDEVSPGARSAFLAWDVAAFSPRENAGLLQ